MHGSSWEQGSAGPSGESCLDTPPLRSSPLPPALCWHCRCFPVVSGLQTSTGCNPRPRPQPPRSQVLLAKSAGSAHSTVGWGRGLDAPCTGSGSHLQHNTVVLGRGLSQPLSCRGLPSSQPQAPHFLTPGHLCSLLFLMVPEWHHPTALCSPTTGPPCTTLPWHGPRHGPRTAQSCQ